MKKVVLILIVVFSVLSCSKRAEAPSPIDPVQSIVENIHFENFVRSFMLNSARHQQRIRHLNGEDRNQLISSLANFEEIDDRTLENYLHTLNINAVEFDQEMKMLEDKYIVFRDDAERNGITVTPEMMEVATEKLLMENRDILHDYQSELGSLEVRFRYVQPCMDDCVDTFEWCVVRETALGIFRSVTCFAGSVALTVATAELCGGCGALAFGLCAPAVTVVYTADLVACSGSFSDCAAGCD